MLSNKEFYNIAKSGVVISFYKREEYAYFLDWMQQFLENITTNIDISSFPIMQIFDSVQDGTYHQPRKYKPINNEIFSIEIKCRPNIDFTAIDCGWMPNTKWFTFTSPYKNYKYFDYSDLFDSFDIDFSSNFNSLIA